MKTDELPLALLAVLAMVAVAPIWTDWLAAFDPATAQDGFLAALVIPATMALLLASWIKPEFTAPVLGVFMIVSFMALAPWIIRFAKMGAGELGGLSGTLMGLAIPVIVLSYLVSLGKRRVSQ